MIERILKLFVAPKEPPPLNPPSMLGQVALEIALRQIGKGETTANNKGPDVVKYRRGLDDGQPWCAAFISYCFEEAAAKMGLAVLPFKRSHSAKRLYARIAAAGFAVPNPRRGDVACWHRGAADALTGHIGIVSDVDQQEGTFKCVEGNRGSFPARVREFEHALGEAGLVGFARPAV